MTWKKGTLECQRFLFPALSHPMGYVCHLQRGAETLEDEGIQEPGRGELLPLTGKDHEQKQRGGRRGLQIQPVLPQAHFTSTKSSLPWDLDSVRTTHHPLHSLATGSSALMTKHRLLSTALGSSGPLSQLLPRNDCRFCTVGPISQERKRSPEDIQITGTRLLSLPPENTPFS